MDKLVKLILVAEIAVLILQLVLLLLMLLSYSLSTPASSSKAVNIEIEEFINDAEKVKYKDAGDIMNELVTHTETVRNVEDTISYEDAQCLMKIAMAEAESDGVEGKAMVMSVVLNRVDDDRFPNTVQEVIYQPHQFSPVSDGRYDSVEIDAECHIALAHIEMGKYDGVDALYFENAEDSWQSNNCEYLYKVGHHRFYK